MLMRQGCLKKFYQHKSTYVYIKIKSLFIVENEWEKGPGWSNIWNLVRQSTNMNYWKAKFPSCFPIHKAPVPASSQQNAWTDLIMLGAWLTLCFIVYSSSYYQICVLLVHNWAPHGAELYKPLQQVRVPTSLPTGPSLKRAMIIGITSRSKHRYRSHVLRVRFKNFKTHDNLRGDSAAGNPRRRSLSKEYALESLDTGITVGKRWKAVSNMMSGRHWI